MPTSSDQQPKSLQLSEKQIEAIEYIVNGDSTLLVADTGEGKTTICLHAIKEYIESGDVTQCIVAAPASVIAHWPTENIKWGTGLQVAVLKGAPEQRRALLFPARYVSKVVVEETPHVVVVSLNNLEWLLEQQPVADMIIVDELSKAAGKQTKKLRNKKWREQLTIRVGMTATPVSESFEKLFGMMRVVDCGDALGRTKEGYLNEYFMQTDYKGYKHELRVGSAERIMAKLENVLHTVTSNKRNELPPVTEKAIWFDMSEWASEDYADMKKDMLVEYGDTASVAANQAVVSGKLRQIASGFLATEEEGVIWDYDDNRARQVAYTVADMGLTPCLVLYQYNHQLSQLRQALLHESVAYIYGGSDKEQALADFKSGKVHVLVAQETTISHGVDGLQHVCSDLIFMQPCWSGDTRIQAIGRLDRKGQTKPVTVTTLMCNNSLDTLVEQRQGSKAENMKSFLQHLKQD